MAPRILTFGPLRSRNAPLLPCPMIIAELAETLLCVISRVDSLHNVNFSHRFFEYTSFLRSLAFPFSRFLVTFSNPTFNSIFSMDDLPIAFTDDPDPEPPTPRPQRTVSLALVTFSVLSGFLLLLLAPKLPSGWSVPRTICNFAGCLLASPILLLFFRAYHEVVPKIFAGEHGSPAHSDSEPEFTIPTTA
jgi:hypothetical protein